MARRRTGALIGTVVVVGLLVGGAIVADASFRSFAENQIKRQLVHNLPAGVSADPAVTIGGVSFIAQYLAGSLDTVTIDDPRVEADGVRFATHITADGVPVDGSAVRHVTGDLSLDQENVRRVAANAGLPDAGAIALGDGTLGYQGAASFLGLEIGYEATAKPVARGSVIELEPTALKLTGAGLGVDLSRLLEELAKNPVSICVAQYLPDGVQVTGIDVTRARAQVTLAADDLPLTEEALGALGSCGA